MIPAFLLSDEQKRFINRGRTQMADEMLLDTKRWDPQMKWEKRLGIDAVSYNEWLARQMLDTTLEPSQPGSRHEDGLRRIPGSRLAYVHNKLPARSILKTYYGPSVGKVCFDGDVIVPAVIDLKKAWDSRPGDCWMSLTPAEVFSMRGGTRMAKGHVVIAGLGLGLQLVDVAQRKSVTKITLVERDRGLVEWVMPRLQGRLAGKPVEVIVGDAWKKVPELRADVALIDIFPGYGCNEFDTPCPGIPKIWVWGSSEPRVSESIFG